MRNYSPYWYSNTCNYHFIQITIVWSDYQYWRLLNHHQGNERVDFICFMTRSRLYLYNLCAYQSVHLVTGSTYNCVAKTTSSSYFKRCLRNPQSPTLDPSWLWHQGEYPAVHRCTVDVNAKKLPSSVGILLTTTIQGRAFQLSSYEPNVF